MVIDLSAYIALVSSGPSKLLLDDVLVNCTPCVEDESALAWVEVLDEECVLSCVEDVDDVVILWVRLKKAIVRCSCSSVC